jgi:hypothetical protein
MAKAKLVCQLVERRANHRSVGLAGGVSLPVIFFDGSAEHLLVEFSCWPRSQVALKPVNAALRAKARIHARGSPPRNLSANLTAQVGFLHHVLGVVIVTNERSREVARSIRMPEECAVEVDGFGIVQWSSLSRSPPAWVRDYEPVKFIPDHLRASIAGIFSRLRSLVW